MTPKELKNNAPTLYGLQKLKHGFIIPDGYIETIEEVVLSLLFLDTLDKKHTFKTPKNYFNSVESSVFEKIADENAVIPEDYFNTIEDKVFKKIGNEPKVISIKRNLILKFVPIAIAASILLIFTLQLFNSTNTNQFTTLNTSEIEQWISNGEIDIEAYEIASIYNTINIEDLTIYNDYQEDEILNYLNEIDVASIILEK